MTPTDALLQQLNPHQQQAVTYCDGPQLIIAGAGSGKTRVLTYKIAYLLQQGMKPWNVLALTFTNKAAKEMKERIASIVGGDAAAGLQMGTFHSIFARLLRADADCVGYGRDFTIYDESDSRSLLKKIVKEMGLDDKTYRPATIHANISKAKNGLCSPEDYANNEEQLRLDTEKHIPEMAVVYRNYQQRLRQSNAMDFDDLLMLTHQLLAQHDEVRQKLEERFEYVLVDEYQDTNFVQERILHLLTQYRNRLCVVGDDFQSIYAFRGANIQNILHFQQVFPGAKLFKLEQNYRSTQSIVQAANSLMKHNSGQIPKELYSENEQGDRITICELSTDRDEANMVCREIKRIKRETGCQYKDFAILYRTNAQSRTIEEAMRSPEQGLGGHYRIYGGLSFYQRKEVKDIIAYFRLVANPLDEEAFARVVNYPARGIGATTLQRLAAATSLHGVSAWEVLGEPDRYPVDVSRGTMAKLQAFRQMVASFIALRDEKNALELAEYIIETTRIQADLDGDDTPEGEARRENVDALLSGIANFVNEQQENGLVQQVSLVDYLATVSLMTSDEENDDDDDKISLMTIHAAKGLEFTNVFVVGVEENILPGEMAQISHRAIEEERRLLYVAMTRAEQRCCLSWVHCRWRFGRQDPMVMKSRFLRDIDTRLVHSTTIGTGTATRGWGAMGNGWNDGAEEDNAPWAKMRSGRMQNSRPVASQFMADPLPKVTQRRAPEQAVNPFGPGMQQQLQQQGRWTRVAKAMTNGQRTTPEEAPTSARDANGHTLRVGSLVEHPMFGRGTVLAFEGTGSDAKATVEFRGTGRKTLLLKFARFSVVE